MKLNSSLAKKQESFYRLFNCMIYLFNSDKKGFQTCFQRMATVMQSTTKSGFVHSNQVVHLTTTHHSSKGISSRFSTLRSIKYNMYLVWLVFLTPTRISGTAILTLIAQKMQCHVVEMFGARSTCKLVAISSVASKKIRWKKRKFTKKSQITNKGEYQIEHKFEARFGSSTNQKSIPQTCQPNR